LTVLFGQKFHVVISRFGRIGAQCQRLTERKIGGTRHALLFLGGGRMFRPPRVKTGNGTAPLGIHPRRIIILHKLRVAGEPVQIVL
jgi:hypothetical protein